MDSEDNKPADNLSDEITSEETTESNTGTRNKRSAGVPGSSAPIKPPVIVITGGADKLKKPGGGGGSMLGQPKPTTDLNEKRRRESEQLAKATAKASAEALKRTQAEQAARAKAQAAAQAKAKAERDALTAKLKKESDERLKKNREQDAKKATERAKAEADRKAVEAKAKADAAARAKAGAETKAKADQKALFAKAGVKPAPAYTPQMVAKANTAMKAPGGMVLNQAPGSFQLAMAGAGTWTAAGDVAGNIAGWFSKALSKLSVPEVSPGLLHLSLGSLWFHSEPAGEASQADIDRQTGRNWDAVFALNAQHLVGQGVKIEPGAKTVNLPVRGQLVNSNGQLALVLLKTGNGALSAAVPVLNAVRDAATGLDKITVPAVSGAPARTILVNPAPAPSKPSNTGNRKPVPVTPVHTGTAVKPVVTPVTTTAPVAHGSGLRDFIYWRPDAAGTGVEPVYVMLSQDPRDLPGKVTGKGQGTGEKWLNDADKGIGVPIPSQIADRLRGRKFVNFDAFRKALWTEVGKDSELLKQFKNQNKTQVTKGKSSFVRKPERAGDRKRFELHHIKRVTDGGAVYDIDNLRVVTPKHHIEIHRGNK